MVPERLKKLAFNAKRTSKRLTSRARGAARTSALDELGRKPLRPFKLETSAEPPPVLSSWRGAM